MAIAANQIGRVSFEVSNAEAMKDEARKLAVANARKRAELYAKAAGVELGQVLRIFEANRPHLMGLAYRMSASAGSLCRRSRTASRSPAATAVCRLSRAISGCRASRRAARAPPARVRPRGP